MAQEHTIDYHLDRVTPTLITLMMQGWAVDREKADRLYVEDEEGTRLPAYTERLVRPDVNELFQMETDYESGFHVVVELRNIVTRKVFLVFENDREVKKREVDLQRDYRSNMLKRRFGKTKIEPWSYDEWFRMQMPSAKELRQQKKRRFQLEPAFSIVIPLYNTPEGFLKEIIDSVIRQTYGKWELCLADGSTSDETGNYIKKNYGAQKRIKYIRLKENRGISINTNRGLALASGDFIVFADHDDTLAPNALYELVKAYNEDPETEILYTDEDKINKSSQNYFEPHFKSVFDQDLLESNNYICHIFAVKRNILDQVGMLRAEYDGAQDYDFVLRCCEMSEHIRHIPKVLYHWRVHPDSTAGDPGSKTYAFEAGRKALEAHFRRCNVSAEVEFTDLPGRYRVRRQVCGNPLVSILIPSKDHVGELQTCIRSVLEKTVYQNYEILIIENNSTQAETFAWYEQIQREESRVRVITWEKEFNYAAIHNWAAGQAGGEYLLLLNNDVEVLSPEWMEELLSNCQREDVGAVGAKLYYPDGTIQHAGVVAGFGGVAGHLMAGCAGNQEVYVPALLSVHQVSAVTAACMMTKKSLYRQVGGMDEEFVVAYNDVDYCMKLREAGKHIVFTPYAQLTHYESKTRGLEDTEEKKGRLNAEAARFAKKWPKILKEGDPYFNQQLFSAVPEYRSMRYPLTEG